MLALGGCDVGNARDEPSLGPALRVLSSYPTDGDGTNCTRSSPPECGVPTNAVLELRLDRYIRPSDGLRQAIVVYSGDRARNQFTAFEPDYDMVERVISFKLRTGARFDARALYTLEVLEPELNRGQGLHAFDGAALEAASAPLSVSFITWNRLPAPPPPAPHTPADCAELFDPNPSEGPPILAVCAACHRPPAPPMGLDLSSAAGLTASAIGRVAHETETGDSAGRPLRTPPRFGVQMPIIDANFPANSYMLYKLLLNEGNLLDDRGDGCTSAHLAPLPPGDCLEPARAEAVRLREWFVRGDPMPPDGRIGREAVQRLARWIAAGAPCRAP